MKPHPLKKNSCTRTIKSGLPWKVNKGQSERFRGFLIAMLLGKNGFLVIIDALQLNCFYHVNGFIGVK